MKLLSCNSNLALSEEIATISNIPLTKASIKKFSDEEIFVEVKNVTLSKRKGVAEFPDAITSRGLKHIEELLKASQKGYKIYLLFLIQRDDCNKFKLAKDIDPKYCELLTKAVKKNLNILCYDCKFSTKGIKLNRKIHFKIK